jgi:hypothetical protein
MWIQVKSSAFTLALVAAKGHRAFGIVSHRFIVNAQLVTQISGKLMNQYSPAVGTGPLAKKAAKLTRSSVSIVH